MIRKWSKLGKIFEPSENFFHSKLQSHASNPVPVSLGNNIFRIFYSARDGKNRSSISAIDLNITSLEIIKIYDYPLLLHGKQDSFFSHGISLGNFYKNGSQKMISFMGWKVLNNGRWQNEIGNIELDDTFMPSTISETPMIKLDSEINSFSLSYPWIMKIKSGKFMAWYGSTISWDGGNGEMIHPIYYAESSDGTNWTKNGLAIPFEINKKQLFSKPCVLCNEGYFKMWFSVRSGNGDNYKIQSASSSDAIHWNLNDSLNELQTSNSGWDSKMVAYPYVFEHKKNMYMLYNGNGFGKTGFGLAKLT